MYFTPLLQRSLIALAVITAMGILIHDTKFDKLVLISLPVAVISFGVGAHAVDLGNSAHTHVERVSLSNALRNLPRVQPRDDNRRHYLQKHMSRTGDFYGGSQILWPSV